MNKIISTTPIKFKSRKFQVAGSSADQGGAVVTTEDGREFRTLCHLPVEKVSNHNHLAGFDLWTTLWLN